MTAFWIVLGVCALAITITNYLSRRETEATIRLAIERGAIADPETIAKLSAPRGLPWAQRLVVLGVVLLFAGAGVAVFAVTLGAQEPESVLPLMGIAGFVAALAIGLLVAGVWLRRAHA